MIFLSGNIYIQIAIIVGTIVLFLGSFILNKKIKAPKGTSVPDKCQSCQLNSCIVKNKDAEELKEDFKKYVKECENEKK